MIKGKELPQMKEILSSLSELIRTVSRINNRITTRCIIIEEDKLRLERAQGILKKYSNVDLSKIPKPSDYKANSEKDDVLLRKVISAWESLQGGRNYSPIEIEEWLGKKMSPVINEIRLMLNREQEQERSVANTPNSSNAGD